MSKTFKLCLNILVCIGVVCSVAGDSSEEQEEVLEVTTPAWFHTPGDSSEEVTDATTTLPPWMTTVANAQEPGSSEEQEITSTTPTPPACNVASATACARDNYSTLLRAMQTYVTGRDVTAFISTVCSKYLVNKQCIETNTAGCSRQPGVPVFDLGLAGFNHVCSKTGITAAKSILPCVSKPEVLKRVGECSAKVARLYGFGVTDQCRIAGAYSTCVSEAACASCTQGATLAVQRLVAATFRPITDRLQCAPSPLPLDLNMEMEAENAAQQCFLAPERDGLPVAPQVRRDELIACFSCSSRAPNGRANPYCTESGTVKRGYVQTCMCRGPCYSKTQTNVKGGVERGCSDGFRYLFPEGVTQNGCVKAKTGETWCFCATDQCNKSDMLPALIGYF